MRQVMLRLLSASAIFLAAAFPEICSAQVGAKREAKPARAVFTTAYARLTLDARGFITSLAAGGSGKEYVPAGRPSPLLSLHETGKKYSVLVRPFTSRVSANRAALTLKYPNGAVATLKIAGKSGYFRFQLTELANRGKVDAVVWGPLDTTISQRIGDLIGVVRDKDFAIGMFGLDDNTVRSGHCMSGRRSSSQRVADFPLP